MSYCDKGNRCFVLCKSYPSHLPAYEYFKHNNKTELGFKNFSSMKNELGPEGYKACTRAVSVSLCETELETAVADD